MDKVTSSDDTVACGWSVGWPGKDITVLGSGELVRSLLRDGLLDELTLMVHPVVLGGKRLFEDRDDRKALELAGSRAFGTGVVSLAYRPTHKE